MRRGALERLRALRDRAERRAADQLRERQAWLAEARRRRGAEPKARPGEGAGAGDLALVWRQATWAEEEERRLALCVAEALAAALARRAAAEAARVLEAGRREAARRERSRRSEEAAGEEFLARAHPAHGRARPAREGGGPGEAERAPIEARRGSRGAGCALRVICEPWLS